MNPISYGGFAFRLVSHKLCRWLIFLLLPGALAGLGLLALSSKAALVTVGLILALVVIGGVVMRLPEGRRVFRPFLLMGFFVAVSLAALIAWSKALRGERNPIWEPTRRPG
jgi:hypothetical protein